MQRSRDRGGDAGDLGGEDLRCPDVAQPPGKFPAAGVDEPRIDLVVEEAVHLEDAAAEVATFRDDPLLEDIHRAPPTTPEPGFVKAVTCSYERGPADSCYNVAESAPVA